MDHVESGGHNYHALDTLEHMISRGLLGSWNSPGPSQGWKIIRTVAAFVQGGVDITTWRDQAYRYNDNTAQHLAKRYITHISDSVGPHEIVRIEAGLTVLAITRLPDHAPVNPSFRTEEFVTEHPFEESFATESYQIDEWLEEMCEVLKDAIEAGEPATVIGHPTFIEIADSLDEFEKLCSHVAEGYEPRRVGKVDPIT